MFAEGWLMYWNGVKPLSQALGYEPGSYLEVHKKLDKIQRKHSSSYDPLIHYFRVIL